MTRTKQQHLTDAELAELKRLWHSGLSAVEIGKRLNVSDRNVHMRMAGIPRGPQLAREMPATREKGDTYESSIALPSKARLMAGR